MKIKITKKILFLLLVLVGSKLWAWPEPPRMLFNKAGNSMSFMRMPDGSFAFYNRYKPEDGPLSLPDSEGNNYTLLPHIPQEIAESNVILNNKVLANTQVILTKNNEVITVYIKGEKFDKETAKKVGLSRYLDVWMTKANVTSVVGEPHMIWRGYNGSQMEYQQLQSGRILVPYGSMQPFAKAAPPTGRHVTVILYSDDNGETWTESESKLVSPCYAGFNGSSEGSCEPAIEQLKDGRIWMLMRTAAGFHYESYSEDEGTTWSKAVASRFNTSTGPPNILRHKNGWLVVSWNNCELPLKHEGQGVYGGRDALHIAVSDDEGKTWRGFREIYLDFRRNGNPEKTGDRGTAYPIGSYTQDGKIVILSGQGSGGRNPIVIDPEWIIETKAQTDFSDGLEQWSVYKHYGPAKRWWRARTVGCEIVPNPTNGTSKCLHVRKADEYPADVAVWNFPNGWKGSLTARVMIRKGYQGGMICLNDRFFDPSEQLGQNFAVFKTHLGAGGKIGNIILEPDKWYDIALKWDLTKKNCQLLVDGKNAGVLNIVNKTLNGISYVRFVSTAKELDKAGFLVDRVSVDIEDPYAPPCSPSDQLMHEKRYIKKMVPLWSKP